MLAKNQLFSYRMIRLLDLVYIEGHFTFWQFWRLIVAVILTNYQNPKTLSLNCIGSHNMQTEFK